MSAETIIRFIDFYCQQNLPFPLSHFCHQPQLVCDTRLAVETAFAELCASEDKKHKSTNATQGNLRRETQTTTVPTLNNCS